ncbi:MAG TPA: MBL fold metallo-hydrolase [Gemmatimonadales bacterium]|nr:MBL fold metallo-hydrolase [Gemmatimonadales bacterium]
MTSVPRVPEITAHELIRSLEGGTPVQILDVRAPHRLASGVIDPGDAGRFVNVAGSRLMALGDPRAADLEPGVPVAVVCGHGNSSKPIAVWLTSHGFDARSLRGGMAGWMLTVVPRPLAPPAGFRALLQFDRLGKGALGYALVAGDEALIIDPPRRVDEYLDEIRTLGAHVLAVADTHVHADYLSGGPTLSATLDVPYYLHPADAVYPYDGRRGSVRFTPLDDGMSITIGGQSVRSVHTPGHTEGSVSFLTGDVAFTGDFVFIRSIGRPDLAGKTAAWTEALWASLERARREWPAETRILPAHYANDTERQADRTVAGAFGALPAQNEALRITDPTVFRQWILERTREAPAAYREIKAANVGLAHPSEAEAEELEGGKNECAIG